MSGRTFFDQLSKCLETEITAENTSILVKSRFLKIDNLKTSFQAF